MAARGRGQAPIAIALISLAALAVIAFRNLSAVSKRR